MIRWHNRIEVQMLPRPPLHKTDITPWHRSRFIGHFDTWGDRDLKNFISIRGLWSFIGFPRSLFLVETEKWQTKRYESRWPLRDGCRAWTSTYSPMLYTFPYHALFISYLNIMWWLVQTTWYRLIENGWKRSVMPPRISKRLRSKISQRNDI